MKKITGVLRRSYLVLVFASLYLTGCSVWSNFTTYFNLYYNASEKFAVAEKQMLEQKKNLFTLDEVKPTGATTQSFTSIIEKLSRLLQFKSESAYVDDALLMIGKCFYYQQDYQKATRKFTELTSTFPESELVLETKLWIGKAAFRLRNFEEGNKVFEEVKILAEEEDENDILIQAYVEQISYFIQIENYPDAISNIVKLTEVSEDEQKNAVVTYELGKLYLKIEQYENAAKAFVKVLDYSPEYKIEYDARLEYGKVQNILQKYDLALSAFKDLKSESLFNDFLDQTDLNIGLTYINLGRSEEAFDQLTYVDTTYKGTPTSGIAVLYLGELMEKNGLIDSAFQYYKIASASTAPIEYLDKAKKKVLVYSKYTALRESITSYNKQLVYLEHPEKFIEDSLKFAEEQAKIDTTESEPEGTDMAVMDPEERQQDPEERQRDAERQSGERGRTQQKNVQQKPVVKRLPPVKPNISADSLHSLLSKSEYELAGLFFTEIHIPDSAYYYYSHILNEHPKSPFIARTLYAIGTYYSTISDTVKADSLFELIYNKYPNESIANAAAAKLNKPQLKLDFDPAEEMYYSAEQNMIAEKDTAALNEFLNIFKTHPKSSFAPKALLASGWLMENKFRNPDSAAVLYDSIVTKYPGTKFANAVKGKLGFYQAERKKIQDSLNAIAASKNPKGDSLAVIRDSAKLTQQNDQRLQQEEETPDIPAPVNTTAADSLKPETPEIKNAENSDTFIRTLRRKR